MKPGSLMTIFSFTVIVVAKHYMHMYEVQKKNYR